MPLVILPLFIQAGQSLSDPVDCSEGPITKITMPGAWISADLTFQTSSDGAMFNDMFMPDGTELVFTVIAGTGIFVPRLTTGWVKFRSGTREQPVEQPELREFAVALDVVGVAPATARKQPK